MKCDNLKYNLTWPGMALCLLLQRAPLLKCLVAAEFALAPRVLHVAKMLLTPAVSVGIYNTVTGATGDFIVTGSAEVTVGENLAVAVQAERATPRKVEITGELPPGIVTNQDSNGEVPNGTLLFSGIPTQAGVFSVSARVLSWGVEGPPIRSIDLEFNITFAGPDITRIPVSQRVFEGTTLILEVKVEDETEVIYQWQKNVGQGFRDIVGATERVYSDPKVTAEVEGSYRVVVTKNDVVEIVPGPGDAPAYVTVQTGSALQAWTNTHFDDPNSQEAQELANPDRDALSNLIEFVFDLDPQAPDTGQIPVISSEIIQGMSYRVFTFPALNLSDEIEVLAEGSDNLNSSDWTPLVDGEDGVVIEQTNEYFVIKLPLSTRMFSRLRARVLEP